MTGDGRPALLLVDDRPNSFSQYIADQYADNLVLLRFSEPRGELTPAIRIEEYVRRTAHLPTFQVRDETPLKEEAERYLAWTDEIGIRPTRFCNVAEPRQSISQHFAALAGLPHLTEQQVRWVRDKIAMKDRFREVGLRTAAYARVRTARDVAAFAAAHGWPLVLKPSDSFATIDTFLLTGPETLADIDLTTRTWMVEQHLGGTEWEGCALIVDGEVLDAWPSAMPCRPLEIVEGALNANISVATGEGPPVDLPALVQRIVSGMKIDHGYLHMEFFVDDDAVFVSEVGVRMAGCQIAANHGHAYGFDAYGATLDVYLGRRPSLKYGDRRCVGDLLLPLPGSGIVRDITAPDELLRLPGVIEACLRVRVGESVARRRASNNSSGYVHVAGNTAAEVESRMRHVLDTFRIEITPN